MDYLDLGTFKTRIGETTTTYDVALTGVLDGVERSIRRFLNFDPRPTTATEFYSGTGKPTLTLDRKPVTAVVNVWEDTQGAWGTASGSFDAVASLLTAGTDYALAAEGVSQAPILYRLNRHWPISYDRENGRLSNHQIPCPGAVKVSYTAGESDLSDIIDAGMLEAAARWQLRQTGLGWSQSESVDGLASSLASIPGAGNPNRRLVSEEAERILRPIRRVPFA